MKSSNMTATNEKEQLKARKDFYKDAKVNEGYLKTCDFLGMYLKFKILLKSSFYFLFSQERNTNTDFSFFNIILVLWVIFLFFNIIENVKYFYLLFEINKHVLL